MNKKAYAFFLKKRRKKTNPIAKALKFFTPKVTRDKMMGKMDKKYPSYGFKKHFGYGTKQHIKAILESGITPIHRRSFNPIHNMLNKKKS